jgi:hypothetical protein
MKDELQLLKDDLDERLENAAEAIMEAALAQDMAKVSEIAAATQDLKHARAALIQCRKDVKKALDAFDEVTRTTVRASQTRPIITVHWKLLGVERASQIIDAPTAAETLSRFIEVLVEFKGTGIFQTLKALDLGGSGLVSVAPATDFVNPVTREPYGHRPIGNTGWHVKTQSSTKTKIEQIREIQAALQIPLHAVELEVVPR